MDWTSDHLTVIRTARLRGERTVQYADRSVTYKSDDEMKAVEQEILRSLQTTSTRPRQTRMAAAKGF